MTQFIELDWENTWDPLYGSPIILPENVLLWRGYDTRYEAIPDRYSYYSGMKIVMEYAKKEYRDLGCFITTRPLKILDIRCLINILERIIKINDSDKNLNDFASTMISFGICSLGHQIKLLKLRYKNSITDNIKRLIEIYNPNRVIEQKGVRVAETTNDGFTMAFLQELFKDDFDGFISPRLYTEFHIEKNGQLNPELIIFNPKNSKLKQLLTYPSNVIIKSVEEFITIKHQIINKRKLKSGEEISIRIYMSGGKKPINNTEHHLDEYDDRLNQKNKQTIKMFDRAKEIGRKWREKYKIINKETLTEPLKINKIMSPYFI